MSIDMWGGDAKREAAYWKGEYEEATIARRKLKQDYDAIVKDRDAWRESSKLRESKTAVVSYTNYMLDAHAERLDKIEAFLLKEYERILND